MTVQTPVQHIAIIPGLAGGQPHIAGHRIKVRDIAFWHEHRGMSPDEISTAYDLDLAEVYAALAYYFDHREEIDRSFRQGEAVVEALRQVAPSVLAQKLSEARGD